MKTIRDFVQGDGPEVATGYHRGDSWVEVIGPHTDCEDKIRVLGMGVGVNSQGRISEGLLVRCGGCMLSFVII